MLLWPILMVGASTHFVHAAPDVPAPPTTTPADASTKKLDELILRLGHVSAAVRDEAAADLRAIGPKTRAALLDATKSDDPEIAARALSILRSLPWYLRDDPPSVREILRRHGARAPDERIATVQELLSLPHNNGLEAAIRLLGVEVDAPVRWAIVYHLRHSLLSTDSTDDANAATRQEAIARQNAVKAIDTKIDDPPTLCLVAAAHRDEKPDVAFELYRRAIKAADFSEAVQDFGEVEVAFDFVIERYYQDRQFDRVAEVLRRKADWPNAQQLAGMPEPVADLFALHAKFGPLAGYTDDRRRYLAHALRPPMWFTRAQAAIRGRHRAMARVFDRIGLYASGTDPAQHQAMARFAQRQGYGRAAVAELTAFLSLADDDQWETKSQTINARLILAHLYGQIAEHTAAAKQLEAALATVDELSATLLNRRRGRELSGGEARNSIAGDMHGHYLIDAIARDDAAEINKRLTELAKVPPDNSEVVQEVVCYLQKKGDRDAADRLFLPTEKQLADELEKDPSPTNKNSLAWFYARSFRKLDRAQKLSEEAVAADPHNAAFLDTLAEVHFQRGDVEKAIQLEKQAHLIEPGRPELDVQMQRFLAGRKKK